MDGIIIVKKEKNYTSRDVVNIISKKFKIKKVGHTGTLDPLATGVLVVCLGKATKLVEILTSNDKEYIAEVTLGTLTDTLDKEGNILKDEKCIIEKTKIEEVLKSFIKKYQQTPPIYSAIKVNGKKLYEYARENIEVDIPKREVEIKSIELLDLSYENDKTIFSFKCRVSKGTYIRSLVRDIASSLGTVGIMSDLNRISQGIFKIEDSIKLDDITCLNILSIEEVLKNYYTIDMDDKLYFKVSNGQIIENTYDEDIVVFKYKGKVISIYKRDKNKLRVWKMI